MTFNRLDSLTDVGTNLTHNPTRSDPTALGEVYSRDSPTNVGRIWSLPIVVVGNASGPPDATHPVQFK